MKCKFMGGVKCFDLTVCKTCPIFLKTGQETLTPQQRVQLKTEKIETVDTQQTVACAYCLHQDKLNKFLISTKKGVHKSRAQCPECKNGQLIRTLLADMTPEQYAEWMFTNMAYGGWNKVPFTQWKERLAELGWSYRFWSKYKQLKAENPREGWAPEDSEEQYKAYVEKYGEPT